MDSHSNEIVVDLSPVLKIYKDGRIERLWITPRVPPSLEDPTTGISSKDIIISPNVSARLYLPNQLLENQGTKLPIFVYCHGGGFCAESAFEELEHNYMNILTSQSSVLAVAVEYRLAPEHPLPAAYEDLWTALQWVCSHAANNGQHFGTQKDAWLIHHGDFGKVILGGDSAGANLVHNIALKAGKENLYGDVKIYKGVIGFPYFCLSNPIGNMSAENMKESLEYKLWEFAYPSAPGGIDNPMINPMAKNAPSLKGLPFAKMLVCTSENDVFRERAIHYVEAVKKSGWNGEVELVDVEGEMHCFQIIDPSTSKAKELIKKIAAFILE